jgi:hypothetical protein
MGVAEGFEKRATWAALRGEGRAPISRALISCDQFIGVGGNRCRTSPRLRAWRETETCFRVISGALLQSAMTAQALAFTVVDLCSLMLRMTKWASRRC